MPARFLIRHGESVTNVEGTYAGQSDPDLTHKGRNQAVQAATELKGVNLDLIYSSPLKRAQETAQIIAKQVGYDPLRIVTAPELMERDLGDFTGRSRAEYDITTADKDEYGIEDDEKLHERIDRFLKELPKDKTVLLISHQGAGKMLRAVASGHDWHEAMNHENIPNCHIVKL